MKITVNGREYDSWDQVPAELRQQLAGVLPDADGDGVPDALAGGQVAGPPVAYRAQQLKIGDQVYRSIDEVPPQLRAAMDNAGIGQPWPPITPPPGGEVLLGGEPIDRRKRKHWWRRG